MSDNIRKFPEGSKEKADTVVSGEPNNPVDKAADFLPRALAATKEYFKELVFLLVFLGYVFIAAFSDSEDFDYVGYFFVVIVVISGYLLWNKVTKRDFVYLCIIVVLVIYAFRNEVLSLLDRFF